MKQFTRYDSILQKFGSNWHKIGQGASSIAYEVNDYIVRFPLADTFRYQKEEILLPSLKPYINIQIPQIKFFNEKISYSVHKKIKGVEWGIKTYAALPIKRKKLFIEDIALFFYQLHNIPSSYFAKNLNISLLKPYSLPTEKELFSVLHDRLSSKQIQHLYSYLQEIIQGHNNSLVLCHKDFWRTNSVISDSHRLKGVFDFGNACFGERAEDFKTLFKPIYFSFLKEVLNVYNELTKENISFQRVKQLQEIECFYVFKYLNCFSDLKHCRRREWEKTLSQVLNFYYKHMNRI